MAIGDGEPLERIVAALERGEVLRLLSVDARRRLARAGTPQDLEPDGLLAQAGDPGEAVYVILDGEIEIRRLSPGGRETRLMALGAGALVGEMAVLDGGPRSADMVARRRTRLWRLPRQALLDALQAESQVLLALVAELSRRLRAANAALEARSTLDLGGRLAGLLITEQTGRGLVPLSQIELARRLGASREKVNRKLREWNASGWVETTPAGLRILGAERLQSLSEGQWRS
jgi:CRP-like cAMP-binding protein